MCSCEQGTCPGGCPCGCNHYVDLDAIKARADAAAHPSTEGGFGAFVARQRTAFHNSAEDVPILIVAVERLRATVAARDATLQRVKALADHLADPFVPFDGRDADLASAFVSDLRTALASEATDTDEQEDDKS